MKHHQREEEGEKKGLKRRCTLNTHIYIYIYAFQKSLRVFKEVDKAKIDMRTKGTFFKDRNIIRYHFNYSQTKKKKKINQEQDFRR